MESTGQRDASPALVAIVDPRAKRFRTMSGQSAVQAAARAGEKRGDDDGDDDGDGMEEDEEAEGEERKEHGGSSARNDAGADDTSDREGDDDDDHGDGDDDHDNESDSNNADGSKDDEGASDDHGDGKSIGHDPHDSSESDDDGGDINDDGDEDGNDGDEDDDAVGVSDHDDDNDDDDDDDAADDPDDGGVGSDAVELRDGEGEQAHGAEQVGSSARVSLEALQDAFLAVEDSSSRTPFAELLARYLQGGCSSSRLGCMAGQLLSVLPSPLHSLAQAERICSNFAALTDQFPSFPLVLLHELVDQETKADSHIAVERQSFDHYRPWLAFALEGAASLALAQSTARAETVELLENCLERASERRHPQLLRLAHSQLQRVDSARAHHFASLLETVTAPSFLEEQHADITDEAHECVADMVDLPTADDLDFVEPESTTEEEEEGEEDSGASDEDGRLERTIHRFLDECTVSVTVVGGDAIRHWWSCSQAWRQRTTYAVYREWSLRRGRASTYSYAQCEWYFKDSRHKRRTLVRLR
jgi:hypothetical protein